jgi:peptide/nickel transport system permease protein
VDWFRNQLKQPKVAGVLGLIIGLVLGWFLMGWGIWPVSWENALPGHLRADLKEDYLRMMIDSYALHQDTDKAIERWDGLQPGGETALAGVESNPGSQTNNLPEFIAVLDSGTSAEGEAESAVEAGQPNARLLNLSLVFIGAGGILAVYHYLRWDRSTVSSYVGVVDITQVETTTERGIWTAIKFIIRRTLRGAVVFYIFLTVMYFLSQTILPYDFTHQFILTQAERTEMQEELGLDLPLWQQYINWLQGLIEGDSLSFYGFSATENLKAVVPPSLLIFFTGTLVSFMLGQGLGKWVAWRKPGILSGVTTFSAIALYTSFPPWLVFLLGYFFVSRLEIFRPILHGNPIQDLTRELWVTFPLQVNTVIYYILGSLTASILLLEIVSWVFKRWRGDPLPRYISVPAVLILSVGSWYLFGFAPQAFDILHLAALPIVAYILLSFGETLIVMQTTMVDVMGESYVTLARAKGLPDRVVRDRHAARTALLPVISRLIVSFPYLLTGMVIIERAVSWPGMGNNLFDALYNLDMPVVMSSLLVVGVISVIARLTLEVIQLYSDPRISRTRRSV